MQISPDPNSILDLIQQSQAIFEDLYEIVCRVEKHSLIGLGNGHLYGLNVLEKRESFRHLMTCLREMVEKLSVSSSSNSSNCGTREETNPDDLWSGQPVQRSANTNAKEVWAAQKSIERVKRGLRLSLSKIRKKAKIPENLNMFIDRMKELVKEMGLQIFCEEDISIPDQSSMVIMISGTSLVMDVIVVSSKDELGNSTRFTVDRVAVVYAFANGQSTSSNPEVDKLVHNHLQEQNWDQIRRDLVILAKIEKISSKNNQNHFEGWLQEISKIQEAVSQLFVQPLLHQKYLGLSLNLFGMGKNLGIVGIPDKEFESFLLVLRPGDIDISGSLIVECIPPIASCIQVVRKLYFACHHNDLSNYSLDQSIPDIAFSRKSLNSLHRFLLSGTGIEPEEDESLFIISSVKLEASSQFHVKMANLINTVKTQILYNKIFAFASCILGDSVTGNGIDTFYLGQDKTLCFSLESGKVQFKDSTGILSSMKGNLSSYLHSLLK